jgi:hypothetical protein
MDRAERLHAIARQYVQPMSDAVCADLKPSGGRTSSIRTGTSMPRSSPSRASSRHHPDLIALADQTTTTLRASSSARWITVSNLEPAARKIQARRGLSRTAFNARRRIGDIFIRLRAQTARRPPRAHPRRSATAPWPSRPGNRPRAPPGMPPTQSRDSTTSRDRRQAHAR